MLVFPILKHDVIGRRGINNVCCVLQIQNFKASAFNVWHDHSQLWNLFYKRQVHIAIHPLMSYPIRRGGLSDKGICALSTYRYHWRWGSRTHHCACPTTRRLYGRNTCFPGQIRWWYLGATSGLSWIAYQQRAWSIPLLRAGYAPSGKV